MRASASRLAVWLSVMGLVGAAALAGCSSGGGGGSGGTTGTAGRGGTTGSAGQGGTGGTGGGAPGTGGGGGTAGSVGGGGAAGSGGGGAGGTSGTGGGGTAGGGGAGAAGRGGTGGSGTGGGGAAGSTGGGGGAAGSTGGGGGAAGSAGGTTDAGGSAGADGGPGDASAYDGPMPAALTLTLASLGTSTATGTAVFEKVAGDQIKVTVIVSNVVPASAEHGIHIHANPDCGSSSDGDGGTTVGGAAGGHWNPEAHMHGTSVTTSHLGDIGNIMVGASGVGTLSFMTDKWTMGTGASNDILNHSLVLHAGRDDGTTQPTGNSGGRIACVVIR